MAADPLRHVAPSPGWQCGCPGPAPYVCVRCAAGLRMAVGMAPGVFLCVPCRDLWRQLVRVEQGRILTAMILGEI